LLWEKVFDIPDSQSFRINSFVPLTNILIKNKIKSSNMVYINDEYRFIFIENPKSGSTSILKALSQSLSVEIQRTPHLQNAHQTCDQLKRLYPDKWEKYIKVTTFRDPLERFCSSVNYPRHHQLRDLHSFSDLKQHLEQQYPYHPSKPFCQYCIPQQEYLKDIDFLINIDTMQHDFDNFCLKVGIPQANIEKINSNRNKLYNQTQLDELTFILDKNQ